MGRWKTRREERGITARSIHARLMANVPTFTTYTTGEDATLTVHK